MSLAAVVSGTSRVAAAVRLDLRLEWRYGAVAAAGITAATWVAVLTRVPGSVLGAAVPLVLFVDSAVIGLFFFSAMVLFEKGERTLQALVVTPLRFGEYLASKLVTFTGLALAGSVIVVLAGGRGTPFDPLPLVAGVTLLSVLTLEISLILAARFDSLPSLLIGSHLPLAPLFFFPLASFFGWLHSPLFWLFPTHAALRLIGGAFSGLAGWEPAAGIACLLAWIAALVPLARRSFQRHIVARAGA
jgi:fluoroquinolone transport system permease protein